MTNNKGPSDILYMVDLSRFYIKHIKANSEASLFMAMHWKTCLRDIYFGVKPDPSLAIPSEKNIECFEGVEAYKFLLQVVCGLKSPMVGETEVFGQYKNFVDSFNADSSDSVIVKKILVDIRNASKKIRSEHLINLGAQSYGSLLRKKINFNDSIHIIGAGQFVEDIAPWISKKSEDIFIHSRDVNKSKSKKALEELKHCEINKASKKSGTLIIAAPLTSAQLQAWIDSNHFIAIYDLRGSSDTDPLVMDVPVVNLREFFSQIKNNKSKIEQKVSQANSMIQSILESKVKAQELHPFGWDDICA